MTTHHGTASPAGTTPAGARPAMGDPTRLHDVRHRICGCGRRATHLYEADGTEHRAIQACPPCAPKAHAWAARAGPVRETHLAPDQPPEPVPEEEPTTLF